MESSEIFPHPERQNIRLQKLRKKYSSLSLKKINEQ